MPQFSPLNGDISADILVIGGGITGILCAYFLTRAGADCVLLEADRLCGGVTGNTTAKITAQHGLIYRKLIREFGRSGAGMYLEANTQALQKFRDMAGSIDCDFENRDSFVYSLDGADKLKKELQALEDLSCGAELTDKFPLPFPAAGALKLKNQAQFNPIKFLSALVPGLKIFEQSPVRELIGTEARTGHGRVTANKVIVATHFPFLNKHGCYFLKMYQHRSYVLALENAPAVNGMYVDESMTGLSFRDYNGLLLIGGGGRKTGKSGGGWDELSDFAKRYFPDASEKYRWATQDCMTLDGVPYIGRYSKNTEDLFVATGFNKWGMTSSMAAALLLTDMVRDIRNPFAALFDPGRTIMRPQLIVNAGSAAANLMTPTKHRCPHLGCALKWNSQEHTWDCPCHGSRFTKNGKLIEGPATGDAGWREQQ